MGRPPKTKENRRSMTLRIRVSPKEWEEVNAFMQKRADKGLGGTWSTWFRSLLFRVIDGEIEVPPTTEEKRALSLAGH